MKSLPKYLTKEEMIKLIDAAKSLRDKVMILFMYNTGVRVSEMINLQIEDINFENNSVRVIRGKGAKDRTVNLDSEFAMTMKAFIGNDKKGPLFLSNWLGKFTPRGIQKKIKSLAKIAKISNPHTVKPHTLRHTHAVHALDSGVNIVSIKKHLGHENIRTTMIYTEISDSLVKKDFESHEPFRLKDLSKTDRK